MAYLSTVSEIQKYVTVRRDFNYQDLKPFIKRAYREYYADLTGSLYTELLDQAVDETTKGEARELLEEGLACFAMYLALSELSLQIGGDGIFVHSSQDHEKASAFDKNDFSRSLLRTGHKAIDLLLKHLQKNAADFTSYTQEYQDVNAEFLVPDTATFQKYYNIHNSRQTFIALQPLMRVVQDQYVNNWLCTDFITSLRTTTPAADSPAAIAKEILQKAIVAYTISKAVYEGQFIIEGSGIYLRFDELPHEKTVTNLNLKINDFLVHTHTEKANAGAEYLKSLKRHLVTNAGAFTQCDGAVIIVKEKTSGSNFVSNKRILGL